MNEHDIRKPGLTEHTRVGEQSIAHRREFAASAALVQKAHTDPELFSRWMGPRGTAVRLDRFDPATGGAFRGSYHEVSPGLIVHTWEYEDELGVTLGTLRFNGLGAGRSELEVTSTYTSKAACDAMLESGLDAGMDENFERLDAALATAS